MAMLEVTDGPEKGRQLALANHPLVSIGRDDQCTFQLVDKQVSRKHLQVRFDEDSARHYAADYRSANGVFLNGERIIDDALLRTGDVLRIGETVMIYTAEDDLDDSIRDAVRKKDEWRQTTLIDDE